MTSFSENMEGKAAQHCCICNTARQHEDCDGIEMLSNPSTGECATIVEAQVVEAEDVEAQDVEAQDVEANIVENDNDATEFKDIRAYTCASRGRCRELQASKQPDGAACGRRHRCTKCRRYAHQQCRRETGNQGLLCQRCYHAKKEPNEVLTDFFAGLFCPATLVLLILAGLPLLLLRTLRKVREQLILHEYYEKGIELEGRVIRRWVIMYYSTERGAFRNDFCSLVYKFPGQTGLFRCDVSREALGMNTEQWSRMTSEGSRVKLLALRGHSRSGRVVEEISPMKIGLVWFIGILIVVFVAILMLLPSILLWTGVLNLEGGQWIATCICIHAILGCQLLIILVLYKTDYERKKLKGLYRSVKAGDIGDTTYTPGCLGHEGEDW